MRNYINLLLHTNREVFGESSFYKFVELNHRLTFSSVVGVFWLCKSPLFAELELCLPLHLLVIKCIPVSLCFGRVKGRLSVLVVSMSLKINKFFALICDSLAIKPVLY